MTTRTFIQRGKAYGTVPCTITAKIDNTIVYEGPVTTVDQTIPEKPATDAQSDLFSWTSTVDFEGTQTMEITVTGSTLLINTTVANYSSLQNPGVDQYGAFFFETIGGVSFQHPLSNLKIDGVVWPVISDETAAGQPLTYIRPGQVYTADVRIKPGFDFTPATPT
jgi:hypothetical protein